LTHPADAIVIGGGIAGLQAARDLTQAGLHVILLEARDRLGGRVWTRRTAHYPVELGAEFIHGRPPEIFSLISRHNLRYAPVEGSSLSKANGHWHNAAKLWDEVNHLLDDLPADEPDQTFEQYVTRSHPREEVKQNALNFVEGFHAADPARVSVHWLIQAAKAEQEIDGEQSFRLVDGYASLVHVLEHEIERARCRVHLHEPVKQVVWKRQAVTVTTTAAKYQAPRALITLPLSVLKSGAILFDPPLTEKQLALQQLETGPVIRVSLCFGDSFIEDCEQLRRTSFLFTDDPDFPTWWTSNPLPFPILTAWAGGPRARAWAGQPTHCLIESAENSLERILEIPAAELRAKTESAFVHNWESDPYSCGAYSYALAGGAEAFRVLAEPLGETLFFAGEATDFRGHNGTVHGAIASGSRAAGEIVEAGRGRLAGIGWIPS
jgi:monoamine oxidase